MRADRLIVFDGGKIKFDDTPENVFEHEEELLSLGLDVPQSCALAHRLKKMGLPIKDKVLSPHKVAEEILRLKKND